MGGGAIGEEEVTLTQVRKIALALPETEESPHFDRTSFRVRGKIFVTAKPDEPYVHIFVGDEIREPVLAVHDAWVEKLMWGGKAVGLRVALAKASAPVVKSLVEAAWAAKAPKRRAPATKAHQ